jgi:hypothetical protein
MGKTAATARSAEVVLGHCEFCSCDIEVRVFATRGFLTPFGECAHCRRFTIWDEVDTSAFNQDVPEQRFAS